MFSYLMLLTLSIALLLLVWQESGIQPAKGKPSTRLETIDYNPHNQTVLLNVRISWVWDLARQSANNFEVQALRWPDECTTDSHCSSRPSIMEATLVQSRRICTATLNSPTVRCDQMVSAQSEFATVTLEHIYTGCYCFRLVTFRDSSTRTARQLLEKPRFFQSDVMEYDVFKWNLSLDLSPTKENDLSLFLRLEKMYKFESYHVDLFRHEELDSDLLACHETDDPMNEHLTITFDDSVRWLTFFNRSYGYYCVVVTPDDARCNPSLVVDLDTTCTRHSNIVELRGLPNVATLVVVEDHGATTTWNVIYFVCGGILALAVVFTMLVVLLKLKTDDSYETLPPDCPERAINNDDPILLFYSHRSRALSHKDDLKRLLRQAFTQVYDDADDDLIDVYGVEWFSHRLGPTTRVVMILCPEMEKCQNRIWNLENDLEIDEICHFRLFELLHVAWPSGKLYRQVYAINFDDLDGNRSEQGSCFLTPYRLYRLPADQYNLMNELLR